jgi:hypothetical protein
MPRSKRRSHSLSTEAEQAKVQRLRQKYDQLMERFMAESDQERAADLRRRLLKTYQAGLNLYMAQRKRGRTQS